MKVAVVGAGIAGLAAARSLSAEGHDVVVLEGAPEIGGKLRLADVGGVLVDVGAEAMLNRRPEAVDLAREVGLGELVVHPETVSARLWSGDRLVSMPRTMMGAPADATALAGVVGDEAMMRAAGEASLPPVTLAEGEDVAVGRLIDERFGPEVTDRVVEPLLGGVYAGHARELSLRATVAGLAQGLDGTRSLTRIAQEHLARTSDTPVFAGIAGGLGLLPMAVAAGLDVRTDSMVRSLRRTPAGFALEVGPTREVTGLEVEAVVVATPAVPAARLLADVAPVAGTELAGIEYASMAVVTLALEVDPGLEGSGFLVPPVLGRAIKAATFSHTKWAWVADDAQGLVLLRCSLGRHREEQVLQVDDDRLVDLALADLTDALGEPLVPVAYDVQRWGGSLPQYAVGHLDRVARIRASLDDVPGLAVCGAAYDGVGIPACIASAARAVEKVTGAR